MFLTIREVSIKYKLTYDQERKLMDMLIIGNYQHLAHANPDISASVPMDQYVIDNKYTPALVRMACVEDHTPSQQECDGLREEAIESLANYIAACNMANFVDWQVDMRMDGVPENEIGTRAEFNTCKDAIDDQCGTFIDANIDAIVKAVKKVQK